MPVVVIATITPLPEHRQDVLEAFRAAVPLVHDEDGCELYALHEGPDRLVMVEQWASEQALAAHMSAPALAELSPKLQGKLAGAVDVVTAQPVPAGDRARGRLVR